MSVDLKHIGPVMSTIPDDKLLRRTKKFLQHLTAYQNKMIAVRDSVRSSYYNGYFVMPFACLLSMFASMTGISYFRDCFNCMVAIIVPLFLVLIIMSIIVGCIQDDFNYTYLKLNDYLRNFHTYSLEISQKHVKEPDAKRLEVMRNDVVKMLKYVASVKDERFFQFVDIHFKSFV